MPQQRSFTEFEKHLVASENQRGTALAFVLSWIANADGVIDDEEVALLSRIAGRNVKAESISALLQLASNPGTKDLQLACEILQQSVTGDDRHRFVQMVLGMAMADGVLSTAENHIIRFLADVIGVGEEGLKQSFAELMGPTKILPKPSDVSSARWWRSREPKRESYSEQKKRYGRQAPPSSSASTSLKRLKALAALGLDDGASQDDIRKAYKRMAQVHHPDKFTSLGDEAVEAASDSFRRIKEAYDYLT